MKSRMIILFLLVVLSMSAFTACRDMQSGGEAIESGNNQHKSDNEKQAETGNGEQIKNDQDVIILKFDSIDYASRNYEKYNGMQVIIRGYMSSLSPLDGKFIYLMNIPYQVCPFCQPNTATIVNTVAVYASDGKRIDFYDGPIEINGILEVGDTVDEFGYFYPFKIVNASYTKLDTSQLSENAKMYGALSRDGIINDIMGIVTQIHINAFFETYDDMTFDDVAVIDGAEFDSIMKRITAISKTDYADLISILEEFKSYNDIINKNIEAQKYHENTTNEMADKYYELWDSLNAWLNRFEI